MNGFRWQWQRQSRTRLFLIGLAIATLGGLFIAYSFLDVKHNRQFARILTGGVILTGLGGYKILQALLSDAGAFGEED